MRSIVLVTIFAFICIISMEVQAVTVTLYGGNRDKTRDFDIDAVSQRCYITDTCFQGPNKSASWNGVKSHTKVVFYSNANCQTHQAIGSGAPDGALYFSVANFPQNVAAFMIWETGQFATSGIANVCYLDERTKVNSTAQSTAEHVPKK